MSATPAAVVAAARALLGTPYHHQGRVPGVGVDCAGVPIVIARALGLIPPDFDVTGYPRTPDGRSLREHCDAFMDRSVAPEVGGVVLVGWKDGPPQHLGVVAPWAGDATQQALIHADGLRARRVIETRLQFGRYMRLVQAYRLPGVGY